MKVAGQLIKNLSHKIIVKKYIVLIYIYIYIYFREFQPITTIFDNRH